MASATASPIHQREITLKLTEKEAILLKSMVQNQLIDNEPDDITELRHSIWDALTDLGIYSR